MENKKSLTKQELIKRLKTIAADETPRMPPFMGAMCYDVMLPPPILLQCNKCHNQVYARNSEDHKDIVRNIRKIRHHGYDARIRWLCPKCADQFLAEKKPDLTIKKKAKAY